MGRAETFVSNPVGRKRVHPETSGFFQVRLTGALGMSSLIRGRAFQAVAGLFELKLDKAKFLAETFRWNQGAAPPRVEACRSRQPRRVVQELF